MKAGSFTILAAALLLAMVSPAAAQQPVTDPPIPPPPAPAALTVPNPFAGAAPAALSVPNPLAALTPGPFDLYRSPDGSDRFQRLATSPAPPIVFVPGPFLSGPYYYPYAPAVAYRRAPPQVDVLSGRLVLETIPDAAQVFVDGFYVGLAQEFGLRGRPLELPAGVHRVELRAPGYELLTFSVIIKPNETVRFRGDMQALTTAPVARPAQPAPGQKSLYVIPKCYAGDKPPKETLPRGCDVKKLQTQR